MSLLNVVGCNVCRCASENIEELLTDLRNARHGTYCLQEVHSWSEGSELVITDSSVYRNAGSPSAIVIPTDLGFSVRWSGGACMHTMVLIGCVGVISSYMPDIQKTLDKTRFLGSST